MSEIPPADIVITMGCNVNCPYLPCCHREDWGLYKLPFLLGKEKNLNVTVDITIKTCYFNNARCNKNNYNKEGKQNEKIIEFER